MQELGINELKKVMLLPLIVFVFTVGTMSRKSAS